MTAPIIQTLQLGRAPRVVGTIITEDYLRQWSRKPSPFPCDLVEFRLDGFSNLPDWIRIGKQIETQGMPVIVTLRLKKEGGKWEAEDRDRWPLLEAGIRNFSGVDVEIRSELAAAVGELCGQLGKLSIFSFHDFTRTPPREELEHLLTSAQQMGGIGKIAATANTATDVALLRSMLHHDWGAPICIIGMGPLGRETRLKFPVEGSCFTYGYLDTPGAPGQYSAEELTTHFRKIGPTELA